MRVAILVRGKLDENWRDWFAPLEIEHPHADCTRLEGELRDQTDLYGTISKLRDLGLELISVQADN